MAVKTYYLAVGADGNFAAMADGASQTQANRTDGWTVAKIAATNAAEFASGVKQTSGTFSAASGHPTALTTAAGANAIKAPAALSGTFPATNWVFNFAVRATTASSQTGRIRLRVYKATNAAGTTGVVELTSSTLIASTSGVLSTTVDQGTQITWSPGAITLNNEFLFLVIAWEIVVASGSNSGDVVLRTGNSVGPNGSYFTTPNFVPVVPRPIPPSANIAATSTVGGAINIGAKKPLTPSGSVPYSTQVLSLSPAAYYRLDESAGTNAVDSSPNARNGTYNGGVTLGVKGAISDGHTAALFNGSTGYVAIPVSVMQIPTPTSPFTFEAWYKGTDVDAPLIVGRGTGNGAVICSFLIGYNGVGNAGTGIPTVIVRDINSGGLTTITAAQAVNDGNWHHLVATRSTGKLWTIYIDGAVSGTPTADTMSYATNTISACDLAAIGSERRWVADGANTVAQQYLAGTVDDVAIYPIALSAAQVLANFQAGTPYPARILSLSPKAYWRFDSLSDFSGNGNTLTAPVAPGSTASLLPADSSGSAMDNAIGQYYLAANSASLQVPFPRTIEMWANPRSVSGQPNLVRKDSNEYYLYFDNNYLTYGFFDGSANQLYGTYPVYTFTPGTLYHIVVTDDGTTVIYYINGALVKSMARGSAFNGTGTGPVALGVIYNSGTLTQGYDGKMDEVAIYGRALSAAEVLGNYQAGALTLGSPQIKATSTVSGTVTRFVPPRQIVPAAISATSTVSGSVRALHRITPTTVVAATSTVSGSVAALHRLVTANIAATSVVSGALIVVQGIRLGFVPAFSSYGAGGYGQDPYGGQQVNGITVLSVKPVAPVQVNAISTVSAAVTAKKLVTGANVAATSSVSSAVRALRKLVPTQISATSTVSGAVGRIGAFRPVSGAISATSTVAATLRATRAVVPTPISATSSVSGALRALRRVIPAPISATSTVSGSVRPLRGILAANIAAISTVSTAPLTVRRKIAGLVNATSTVSAVLTKFSGGPKPIVVTPISATSTVGGSVRAARKVAATPISATSAVSGALRALRKIIPVQISATSTVSGVVRPLRRIAPANIAATSTVSAVVSALRIISGIKPYDLGPIYYEADGLYDMELPVDLSMTNAVTLVFKADYQGGDGYGGMLFEYTPNINSTNNGFWVSPGSEWGTANASEITNKYPDGGYSLSEFDRPSNGPHTWCVVFDRSRGSLSLPPEKVWIDGVPYPTAIYGGFADNSTDNYPDDVLYVGHRYGSTAGNLIGGVSMPLVFPYAFTDAAAQLASTGLAAGAGIAATSVVSAAVTKFSGGPRTIIAAPVNAISTVGGNVRVLRKVAPAQINATSTVAGQIKTLKAVRSAQIAATSTVSGTIVKGAVKAVVPAQVSATSTVSGATRALRKIAPTQISATSTVSGRVAAVHKIVTAQINGISTVTGSLATHPVKIISGANIAATSTVTGSIKTLKRVVSAQISATSTVAGLIKTIKRVAGQISATSTVSGGIVKGPVKTLAGNISATSVVGGSIVRKVAVKPVSIAATSSVGGSLVIKRGITSAQVNAMSVVSSRVVTKHVVAGQIAASSTVSAQVVRAVPVKGRIDAVSTVSAYIPIARGILPVVIHATSIVSLAKLVISVVRFPGTKERMLSAGMTATQISDTVHDSGFMLSADGSSAFSATANPRGSMLGAAGDVGNLLSTGER